ncbi:hypothetical protein PACTADRAFT_51971 [Pachysolen tannophilus NRRL Y-2460]|uniref:BTB domain-containing protein n=2 Tax=Pachysolen tannophilus NRRL Y-2460 TaxID=669874 RepID=A0A1E4TNN9_PACTA|nr:hypothetical protein PACTADRAFT_51971 [Pachysolen tannophilus NRRL Y-2460]
MSKLSHDGKFRELCLACRTGDIETVDMIISTGINVNQMDEWNYSPLILASLCGHEDIVKLLLNRGNATCDRDTFEGQRCIYGALNDNIKNILLGFDISKNMNLSNQPFASYISSILTDFNKTSDVILSFQNKFSQNFKLHRFLLVIRSEYFNEKLNHSKYQNQLTIEMPHDISLEAFNFIINYIYLIPCFNNFDPNNTQELEHLSKELKLENLFNHIQELKNIPENDKIHMIKAKNRIQTQIEENARDDLKKLSNKIIRDKIILSKDESKLSIDEKSKLFQHFTCPDILVCVEDEDERKIYFPAHRAILSKSKYFETMFNSSFSETLIYESILENHEVIDRSVMLKNPESIPVISLSISMLTMEVAEIILSYLYYDEAEIPDNLAIEVLLISDVLFIDRLKTMAAISLTKIENFDEISVYDILRAGWQTRVHRLEVFVAKLIANDLDKYIEEEEFSEVILESAQRIEIREDTDTIELIDDIRFYLAKRHAIEIEDDDDENSLIDYDQMNKYQTDLKKLDDLLFKLGLEA